MYAAGHNRTRANLLVRDYIIVMAVGAAMLVSVFPVGQYYWNAYQISEPVIIEYLIIYGVLILILGGIWAVIKKLLF